MMKKYLILLLMSLCIVFANAQTSPVWYAVIKYGSEKELKTASFMDMSTGIQIGTFVTDHLGFEMDYTKGLEYKRTKSYSVGGNVLYQFNYISPDITPFAKVGAAYKYYEIHKLGYCSGVNLKYGVGVNVAVHDRLSLNIGVNLNHFINEDESGWENNLINYSSETEIGICFLLY